MTAMTSKDIKAVMTAYQTRDFTAWTADTDGYHYDLTAGGQAYTLWSPQAQTGLYFSVGTAPQVLLTALAQGQDPLDVLKNTPASAPYLEFTADHARFRLYADDATA